MPRQTMVSAWQELRLKTKLLIVDDSSVSRMIIRGRIATLQPGWDVMEACSGDEAVAMVSTVQPGSGAEKAGIVPGDVITAFNGRKIGTREDLPPLVGPLPAGSKATVTVIRDGKPRDVKVTLSALEEPDDMAGAPRAAPAPSAAPAGSNPLGIQSQAMDATARKRLGIENGDGVLVSRVESASAREAGLAPGMAILQVGRTRVDSPAALDRELARAKVGDTVMLLVRHPSFGTRFLAVTIDKS